MNAFVAAFFTVLLAAGVAFVVGSAVYVLGLGAKSLRDRLREQDRAQ